MRARNLSTRVGVRLLVCVRGEVLDQLIPVVILLKVVDNHQTHGL